MCFILKFHILLPQNHNLKPQKQPSSTPNPKTQLEKTFPDTPKHEFQVEISFSYRKKVISQKISSFRTRRKSERELTNYLLTPKI